MSVVGRMKAISDGDVSAMHVIARSERPTELMSALEAGGLTGAAVWRLFRDTCNANRAMLEWLAPRLTTADLSDPDMLRIEFEQHQMLSEMDSWKVSGD